MSADIKNVLEEPGIEPGTSCLQGDWFINYTMCMVESSKFWKSSIFEIQNLHLKHAACIQNDENFKFKASIVLRHTENTSEMLL